MNVHVLPLAVSLEPDARLLRLKRVRHAAPTPNTDTVSAATSNGDCHGEDAVISTLLYRDAMEHGD